MSKSLKTLIVAIVMACGVSSAAIADGYDYEYEPVGKSFEAPPVFAWTGWYAGMAAGWIRSESEAKLTRHTGDFADPPFDGFLPSKLSHDADGFIAGLTLGYNQKMGVSFVGGIEADIAYTDVSGSKARTIGVANPVGSARVATDMDWFGTVRARAGWLASQQMLLYVTGGLAYADLDRRASASAFSTDHDVDVSASSSKSDWKTGWTVGGGMEWLLGNKTTLKSEYLYYDLEDSSITIGGGADTVRYKLENKGHIVRMGLNVALY
ncbi:MAG: porin family protein [Hyphomicrobium sp.]|nr:porin family protein [Hyphomicrobium sp.]